MKTTFKTSTLSLSIALIFSAVSMPALASATKDQNKAKTNVERAADLEQEKSSATVKTPTGHAKYLQNMPFQSNGYYGAGRFGESRDNNKRAHLGNDITIGVGTRLTAITGGKVVGVGGTARGAGLSIMGSIGNSDAIFSYWHLDSIPRKFRGAGVPFNAGEHIANSGDTGGTITNVDRKSGASGDYPAHLHFGIAVPENRAAIQSWLNNTPKRANTVYRQSMGNTGLGFGTGANLNRKSYKYTHPAPYLNTDVVFRISDPNDPLIKFIGNTNRSHYNALVNANVLAVTTKSVNGITPRKATVAIPPIRISGAPISNDQIMAANQQVLNSAADGELDAQFESAGSYSPDEYAYYAKPRTIFGGNADEVTLDIGDGDISAAEHIDKISKKRFGNKVWDEEMLNISMRGMLTEYLNIINAENYIKKEMLGQKDKIEMLLAAWNSTRAKRIIGKDVTETYAKAQNPDIIPSVSTIPLEELYDIGEFDVYQASSAVNIPTGKYCRANVANAFNSRLSKEDKKWMIALSLKTGFAPNDLAAIMYFESSFNQVYPTTYAKAAGYIQLTPDGMSGVKPATVLNHPHLKKWFSGNSKLKYQKTPMGVILKTMRDAGDYRAEWTMYELYLNSKPGINWAPQHKSLPVLYAMITGGPYLRGNKSTARVIAGNPKWDVNKDGQVDLFEPSLSDNIRSALCPFFTAEQHNPEYWGLSQEDVTSYGVRNKSYNSERVTNHYQTLERIKQQKGLE